MTNAGECQGQCMNEGGWDLEEAILFEKLRENCHSCSQIAHGSYFSERVSNSFCEMFSFEKSILSTWVPQVIRALNSQSITTKLVRINPKKRALMQSIIPLKRVCAAEEVHVPGFVG